MRILVIPDLHTPFHCPHGLRKIISYAKTNKPTHIVQIGDAYDLFAFSRFAKSLNSSGMTGEQELIAGKRILKNMWSELNNICPAAKCYQLLGNHDSRIIKRLEESNPELVGVLNLSTIWKFKKVKTIYDTRQELVLGKIIFIHGYRSKLGDHTRYAHSSVVHGHCHRPGITYIPINNRVMFEMDVGHCINVDSVAASYMPQKITNWTKSFGWIDEDGPRVVLL